MFDFVAVIYAPDTFSGRAYAIYTIIEINPSLRGVINAKCDRNELKKTSDSLLRTARAFIKLMDFACTPTRNVF